MRAETERMPKLVVGYTELGCSKLKKGKGFFCRRSYFTETLLIDINLLCAQRFILQKHSELSLVYLTPLDLG